MGYPVWSRAWNDTWRFTKGQLIASAILSLSGVVWVQPWEQARHDHWWLAVLKWSIPVLGPFVGVFCAVFLCHLWLAPYRVLRDEVSGLRNDLKGLAAPSGSATFLGQSSAGLTRLRSEAGALCQELNQFVEDQVAREPKNPPNLQQGTPQWDTWAKARSEWHDGIEAEYRRRFAHKIQAVVQRMITNKCASPSDLQVFRQVKSESELIDAVREFCVLAENAGKND